VSRDPIAVAWHEAHPGLVPGSILRHRDGWYRSLGYSRGGYVRIADCRYDDRSPGVSHCVTTAEVTTSGLRVREVTA
jgi:hypothetical protein